MSLRDDISRMQEEMIPNIPAEALTTMMTATENLIKSGLAEKAKKTGERASDFTLKNFKG